MDEQNSTTTVANSTTTATSTQNNPDIDEDVLKEDVQDNASDEWMNDAVSDGTPVTGVPTDEEIEKERAQTQAQTTPQTQQQTSSTDSQSATTSTNTPQPQQSETKKTKTVEAYFINLGPLSGRKKTKVLNRVYAAGIKNNMIRELQTKDFVVGPYMTNKEAIDKRKSILAKGAKGKIQKREVTVIVA